jgi:tetratricopeptide (TPR) repeat protein
MLELPGVTLCCIDTLNHELALRALRRSAEGIRFGKISFITDRDVVEAGIVTRVIAPLASRDDYSEFVLKSLLPHVNTPHVLLVQWDGYAINPAAWRSEFLEVDYIGAKWFWHTDEMRVGNGGFSLRSRKLLLALQDPRVVLTEAEDETIGRVFRPLLEREHGIRFASEPLADAFAFEAAYPIGKPFGFHGLFNFCRVVPPEEIVQLVRHFTPAIARSPQMAQLGRNCIAMGQWHAAAAIFQCILSALPGDAAAAAGLATATANANAMPVVNRNDPCPCGSGKRYKHCHGAAGAASSAPIPARSSADERVASALSAHQRGDTHAAEALYRNVLAGEPGHAVAQHYLGVLEYQRGAIDAALPLLERSIGAIPNEPEFRNNLGLAYAAADREADALAQYRAALELRPDYAVAWNNLGLTLQAINDIAGATAAFRRAIDSKPDFAHAHWNLALVLLLAGSFEEGWIEYDWRLALPELGKGRHTYLGPTWDGRPMHGKTLLLYAEQGLGDALQFARYATPIAASGTRVLIHCPEPLQALLASVRGVDQVIVGDAPLPPFDAHVALLSLPRALGTTPATIPAAVPYVRAADERRAEARANLAARSERWKIGIAWAGSKAHTNDRNRSCSLAFLVPLFRVADIAWYSLQQGDAAAEVGATPRAEGLVPLVEGTKLDDTAALIAELDLIISVDTSIVHLAGALARPCWVLLPFAPDWRWMLGRDDSPWYPTLRLFRQPRPRDWPTVVTRVTSELQLLVANASPVGAP